jgi:hypothetical protein
LTLNWIKSTKVLDFLSIDQIMEFSALIEEVNTCGIWVAFVIWEGYC